MSLIVHMI